MQNKKYNILYIVLDATRPDVLGCYGGLAKTPNIDKLAKSGVLFEKAYSTSNCTYPASIALTTGLYYNDFSGERLNGNMFYKMIPNNLCLAKLCGINRDKVFAYVENPIVRLNSGEVALSGFSEFQKAIRQESVLPEQGCLFFAWLMDAHGPYAPEEISPYTAALLKKVPESLDYYRSYEHWWAVAPVESLPPEAEKYKNKPWQAWGEDEIQLLYSLYLSEIEAQDKKVGEILENLRFSSVQDSTYIVLTADHGEAFYEHGFLGHDGSCFFEETTRVPLILVGSSVPQDKHVSQCVSHLDIIPTIQDYTGTSVTPRLAFGESLRGLIEEKNILPRPIFIDCPDAEHAATILIYENIKYIFKHGPEVTVYDLVSDPEEKKAKMILQENLDNSILNKYIEFKAQNKKNQIAFKKSFGLSQQKGESFSAQVRNRDEEKQELLKSMKALGYVQ